MDSIHHLPLPCKSALSVPHRNDVKARAQYLAWRSSTGKRALYRHWLLCDGPLLDYVSEPDGYRAACQAAELQRLTAATGLGPDTLARRYVDSLIAAGRCIAASVGGAR